MRVIDALRHINLYPINPGTAELIATECGMESDADFTSEIARSNAFKKAKAKVYLYLSEAPAVTEAGATYSFTDEERDDFRKKANALLEEIDDEEADETLDCGWIGEDF